MPTNDFHDIDPDRLDELWFKHPRKVGVVARKLARAKKTLLVAKGREEMVAATLKLKIRKNPGKYGISKFSEGACKEVVVTLDAYQEAMAETINAQHSVDVLSGTMTYLEHYKRALENSVTLHGQSYFAAPRLSKSADVSVRNGMAASAVKASFKRRRKSR